MFIRMLAVALVLFLGFDVTPSLRAELIVHPPAPVEVTVRPGLTIKYLALTPNIKPRHAVILFAGGNGLLDLQPDGSIGTNLSGNFLVRSRDRFVTRGLFVAVVDTPNQVAIDGNVRLSAQYAQDMAHVIAEVRNRIPDGGKVWLIGTSTGTISAASIADRLPQAFPTINANLRRADSNIIR